MKPGWQKQEDRIAARIGGQRSAASGAFWTRKGDVRNERFLVEAKWTANKSFSIKSEVLEKVFREAVIEGRIPLAAIELNKKNYVVLLEDDFLEILAEGAA